jgi:hypothetical protein
MGLEYVGRRRILLTGILSDVPVIIETKTFVSKPNHKPLQSEHIYHTKATTELSSKNGHKKEKIRDLYDSEKEKIQIWFEQLNGCIANNACVEFKRQFDAEVKIFQITGYVTALHSNVRRGLIVLRNMEKYEDYLMSHRNLWASYNSPKYVVLRERLSQAVPV